MNSSFFSWTTLIVAGLFEVVWAYYLKNSKGLTVFFPSVMFVVTLTISMTLLALSMRSIPIGTAYPVWTGIGAVGAVLVGVLIFQETVNPSKIFFLTLIVIGIVGLKIAQSTES